MLRVALGGTVRTGERRGKGCAAGIRARWASEAGAVSTPRPVYGNAYFAASGFCSTAPARRSATMDYDYDLLSTAHHGTFCLHTPS